MRLLPSLRTVGALAAATVVATVWGAIVQTQYNLNALAGLGANIPAGLRFGTTVGDILSGFSPTYAGYVVLPALLVAFFVASWLPGSATGWRYLWYGLAGGAAILAGIPLVNLLAPVALLIGATREFECTALMALGGVAAGLVFAAVLRPRERPARRAPRRDSPAVTA